MAIPKHIAIIMDGNGRWAKAQGKKRTEGHKEGVKNVRSIAIYANSLGVKCLTLYAFSTENWKRPIEEVDYLMSLPKVFFHAYLKELMEKNIKVTMIGDINRIPDEARKIFLDAIAKTSKNTGMILNFALNYGSRDEIVKACMAFAKDYKAGLVDTLTEESFNDYLMTAGLPDIDLLIRTSGEERISNFLLYQLAYSELIFRPEAWPDFNKQSLDACLEEFEHRSRRFGGL